MGVRGGGLWGINGAYEGLQEVFGGSAGVYRGVWNMWGFGGSWEQKGAQRGPRGGCRDGIWGNTEGGGCGMGAMWGRYGDRREGTMKGTNRGEHKMGTESRGGGGGWGGHSQPAQQFRGVHLVGGAGSPPLTAALLQQQTVLNEHIQGVPLRHLGGNTGSLGGGGGGEGSWGGWEGWWGGRRG